MRRALLLMAGVATASLSCIGTNPPGSGVIDVSKYPDLGRTAIDPPTEGILLLTFDDGPSDDFTKPIADILAKHGARATFFMVGQNIAGNREVPDYVRSKGHQVANHSFYHEPQPSLSETVFKFRLAQVKANIGDADGGKLYFRFPYGAAGDDQLRWLNEVDVDGKHYRPVGWNMDSQDWDFGKNYPEKTESLIILEDTKDCGGQANPFTHDYVGWTQFTARKTGGGVILFHDIQEITHDHLDAILTGYENPDAYWATVPAATRDAYLKYYTCAGVDPKLKFVFKGIDSGVWPALK